MAKRKNGAGLLSVSPAEDCPLPYEYYPLFRCQGPAFVEKRPIRPVLPSFC